MIFPNGYFTNKDEAKDPGFSSKGQTYSFDKTGSLKKTLISVILSKE
jgi:hypothetical protein